MLAAFIGLRPPAAPQRANAYALASVPQPTCEHASRAIEDIRVGQRVLGENPDFAESEHSTLTAVDPASWRLVRLHTEGRWEDGTLDTIEVETLQPFTWIEQQGARVGRSVPIPCDLEELALPPDLHGTVTAVEPCPEIEDGLGHVVLLTINHLNNTVHDLVVRDTAGHRETIGVTAIHRFYSDTRRDWVAAAQLRIGEQLRGIDGPLTVEGYSRASRVERVYNMSVEGQHVYEVSRAGVLVHNAYLGPTPAQQEAIAAARQAMQNRQNIVNLQQRQQQLMQEGISTPLDNMGGYQNYLQRRLQAIDEAIAQQTDQLHRNHNYMEFVLGAGPAY